ncbi:MAG TPA: thiamine phosphate synthase [Nitrosospira sp.]|nr:thiamine phosphate synthase [Nitrosospira sp.]
MTRPAIGGLYAVTPDMVDTAALLRMTRQALEGGTRLVQYRNKTADPALRAEQAALLADLCREATVPFIINDDPRLAAALDADGVHLGKQDVSLSEARQQLGEGKIIGVSCYNELERALEAERQGADYIAFGAFFVSGTKPRAVRAHLDLLQRARQKLRIPIVAIGGIDLTNAAELIRHGADALAVVNGVFAAQSIRYAAEQISRLFQVKHSHHEFSSDLA